MATAIKKLWVLYDPTCGFCVRCARWLNGQRTFLPMTCLPLDSAEIHRRFPTLPEPDKEELTVVDDVGGVYRGAKGWLMTLWALEEYRAWSMRLARPGLLPLARNAFEMVSSNRHMLSRLLNLKAERDLAEALTEKLGPPDRPRCAEGACETEKPPAPPPEKKAPIVLEARCRECSGRMPYGARRCPWCGLWLIPPKNRKGQELAHTD